MILIVDTETSGFDFFRNSVIELGALLCKDNGDVVSEFREFARPELAYWSNGAEEVHGISLDEALRFQSQSSMISKFADFIANYKNIKSIEHSNAFFDYKMIEYSFLKLDRLYEWRQCSMIDRAVSTLKMARKRVDGPYKLSQLCKRFNIELVNAHSAIEDARATKELYFKLVELSNEKTNPRRKEKYTPLLG